MAAAQSTTGDGSIAISIVSYNTRRDLLACLQSIYSHPPKRTFTVTVVDNGSVDGSADAVREQFLEAQVIMTGENLGYGRANNRALLGAAGEYYAILNSDLVLRAGSLDACCDYLDSHPSAGIVGGALLDPDGSPQMDWAAGELTLRAVACEQLFFDKLFPMSRRCGDYFRSWWPRNETIALPQVCGAFLVVRAELYNRLKGFDPSYFMYCEDTDLCRRIRDAGSECVYLNDATAIHGHGKSSAGALRPRMVLEHNISRCLYFRSHFSANVAQAAKSIMIVGAALRAVLWTAAGVLSLRKSWIVKGQGYRDVYAGTRKIHI